MPPNPARGYYDASGMAAPRPLVRPALSSCAEFNELGIALKRNESAASPSLGFLRLAISFRDGCQEVIASLSLSRERIARLTKLARELREEVN